ncbi:nuclear transport factor 2 family protein [Rhodohalobacter sp. 614A]|uniref:nuclear transport factor 2 family protein n=1 Tax=Rhodohalobacter sp. 614A TaxID=2908649 RepID=UPI001F35F370|nr:nuclear transport factor 2 family protein [Rhodohalobacter sp. 614A]
MKQQGQEDNMSRSKPGTAGPLSANAEFDESKMRAFAKHFFDSAESDDKDNFLACFAPEAIIWINTGELELTPSQTAEVLMVQLSGAITDKKYEQRRVNVFPGGFVERHLLCGTRKTDGYRVEMPACLVIEVNDEGKITRIDNYEDSAKAAEFYE